MTAEFTPEEIAVERKRLGIPDDAVGRRAWFQQQLEAKGWTQAALARATNASETSVSWIVTGQRPVGETADRVRQFAAEVLGIPEPVLFPEAHAVRLRKAAEEAARAAAEARFRRPEWYRKRK